MLKNANLNKARELKNDEFYTDIDTIKNELTFHSDNLKGKVVYCNCDDPEWSSFFKFFTQWSYKLGIKEVHFTNYANAKRDSEQITLFDDESRESDKTGIAKHWKFNVETSKTTKRKLKGDGDFRSQECIDILKKCDVVITNPPFSLFSDFFNLVVNEYKKDIIVIGNKNALILKDVAPLVLENRIFWGYTIPSHFITPTGEINKDLGSLTRWFTTFDTLIDKKFITLNNQDLSKYSKYDNYDAINVDKVKLIPRNYKGVMGVPFTIYDKLNRNQFEVIGFLHKQKISDWNKAKPTINGKDIYTRLLIKAKEQNV